jgi:hypothetical protein
VRAYADDGSVHWTRTLSTFPQDVEVGPDGTVTVASKDDLFRQGHVDRYDANGSLLIHYDLPRLIDEGGFFETYHAFAVVGDELVCASAANFIGGVTLRAVDVATGGTTRWLENLSLAVAQKSALRTSGHGDILLLDGRGTVRKLVDHKIVSRHAPDHDHSPGGAFDLWGARDVAGDSQGRAIEVGGWGRACSAGETCDPDGLRVSGFVRSYVP